MAEPSVFDKLKKLLSPRTAARAARDNPVLLASVSRASEIYGTIPLARFIDDQARNRLARRLYLELNEVCNAFDPRSACRDKLVRSMLRFAPFQVVMIPPPPTRDASGLRELPGITGEIQPRLPELIRCDSELRAEIDAAAGGGTDDETALRGVQRSYWEAYWFLEAINAARLALGDNAGVADWYRPFMHAACVNQEHIYRRELDLPAAFDEDVAQVVVTAFSIYTDVVVSGAADPDEEWRAYCAGLGVPLLDDYRASRLS